MVFGFYNRYTTLYYAKIAQTSAMKVYFLIAECSLSYAKIAQKNRISATKTNLFVLMSERFLSNLKTIQK